METVTNYTQAQRIYVNLPVNDVQKSIEFFSSLGFNFNMQFTGETAAAMELGENMIVMMLCHDHFSQFTRKEIADATKTTEVLVCFEVNTREMVDELVQKAVSAGGKLYAEAVDHGWMYQHSFEDLDGHQWEIMFADLSKFPKG